MSDSEDLFDEGVPFNINPSPTSLGSTPLEFSDTVVGTSSTSSQLQQKTVQSRDEDGRIVYVCPECQKDLKSKSGFTRHIMRHKLDDYASRIPWEDEIELQLPRLFQEVLDIIKVEPTVSTLKVSWTLQLVEALAESSEKSQLIELISKPIIKCLFKKTKVIPSAQFEEGIREHNFLMCDASYVANLKSTLFLRIPEELKQCPIEVVNRLIWRISTQMMFKIQEFCFHKMKQEHLIASQSFVMSEFDRKEFLIHVGMILRATYKFGIKSSNSVWKLRCRCLQDKFVVSPESLTSDQFIDKMLWKENFISLSQPAQELFLGLERILQSLQNSGSPFSTDTVLDLLPKPENLFILNQMRALSQGILSEDLAIDFLGDLIKSLSALSGKLDARKKVEEAKKKQKLSAVSLRTNLKRNPKHHDPETAMAKPPEENEESVDDPASTSTRKTKRTKSKEKSTEGKAIAPKEKKKATKEKTSKKTASQDKSAEGTDTVKTKAPPKAKASETKSSSKEKLPSKKKTPAKEDAPSKKKTPPKEVVPAKKQTSAKAPPKKTTPAKEDAPVAEQRASSRIRKPTERFHQ